MSKPNLAEEWLQIAYEDYDAAAFLFKNKHPSPLEIICYHCQQSVEKSLKGYLCAQNAEVPKIHELGFLCRACAGYNPLFSKFFETCEEIEVFATKTRYPNRIELERHNADKALKQAKEVYDFVLAQIK